MGNANRLVIHGKAKTNLARQETLRTDLPPLCFPPKDVHAMSPGMPQRQEWSYIADFRKCLEAKGCM